MSAHAHQLLFCDALESALDPTGTGGIRRAFRAEAARRLNTVRRITFEQLVERDYMRTRDPLQQHTKADPQLGLRYAQFMRWFELLMDQVLHSPWPVRFINAAHVSGHVAGARLAGINVPTAFAPQLHLEHAQRELAGIGAAMTQRIARTVAAHAGTKSHPLAMYRSVLHTLQTVGANRLNAFANVTTVRLHNAGRLAAFRQGGVTAVGVQAERLPAKLSPPSRPPLRSDALLDKEIPETTLVNVMTAGDDRVCDECDGIAAAGPYDIEAAEGLIPAHPNCRCVFVIDVGKEAPPELAYAPPGQQLVIKPIYEPPAPPAAPPLIPPEEPGGLYFSRAQLAEITLRLAGILIETRADLIRAIDNAVAQGASAQIRRALVALARQRGWLELIPKDWPQ
jgi:hypothetical protein